MSGRKLNNWAYLDSNWQDEIESKNDLKKGFYNLDFTNFSLTIESEISAGSAIDIDGVVYKFDTQESITGSESSSSINYIRVFDSGGAAVAEYTTAAPVWDDDKKGFYSGLKRYVFRFYYSGSTYLNKTVLSDNRNDNFLPINDISSDYTIPDDIKDDSVFLISTTDTLKTTVTLPNAAACPGKRFKFIKNSTTYGPAVLKPFGSQTINNWSYTLDDTTTYNLVPIFFENECCEIISNGSNWNIINNYCPIYDTGVVWSSVAPTTQKTAIQRITLTGVTGTFELFEVIEGGTNGEKGIICNLNGGVLDLLMTAPYNKTTGQTASFQSSEVVTGQSSGAAGAYSTYSTAVSLKYPFFNLNNYPLDSGNSKYIIKPIDFHIQIQDNNYWSNIKDYYQEMLLCFETLSGKYGQSYEIERDFSNNLLKCWIWGADDSMAQLSGNNRDQVTNTGAGTNIYFRMTVKG